MKNKIPICLVIVLTGLLSYSCASARKIVNRHYKFKITVPDRMLQINDSVGSLQGELYYDTGASIILMISGRESKFSSVDDYIDCRKGELEEQLRTAYEDPKLRLISCSKSEYPGKITVVNFTVSVLPFGYNIYIIYFIHHNGKDIQLAFTYKQEMGQSSVKYIADIMETLKLK